MRQDELGPDNKPTDCFLPPNPPRIQGNTDWIKHCSHPVLLSIYGGGACAALVTTLGLLLNTSRFGSLFGLGLLVFFSFIVGAATVMVTAYIFRQPFIRLKKCLELLKDGQYEELPLVQSIEKEDVVSCAIASIIDCMRERDRMKHSLGRIMDPKIAEILIKENPKLGGLRRQATILFCDIRNYTTLSEELSVDELQKFLNEYWKGTVEIIMDQEGTIDKFHGDGICVIFGAPILHEDDPLRAVRTGWRLVKNVEELNKRRVGERKMPIQIGVGIHSGEVIAGHIGSERRMDYTVVGDVVNVAARIQELNKKYGTQILISDQVYEAVENHVRVKTLSLAYLRGHKKPILVHVLREFNDQSSQGQIQSAA